MKVMNAETPFAKVEPIVVLAKHSGISDHEFLNRSAYWLERAAELVRRAHDDYYDFNATGGETVDLQLTNREVDFLIDGLERLSRALPLVIPTPTTSSEETDVSAAKPKKRQRERWAHYS
jgi:hypothetical protein